jgi:hypothetical protein
MKSIFTFVAAACAAVAVGDAKYYYEAGIGRFNQRWIARDNSRSIHLIALLTQRRIEGRITSRALYLAVRKAMSMSPPLPVLTA